MFAAPSRLFLRGEKGLFLKNQVLLGMENRCSSPRKVNHRRRHCLELRLKNKEQTFESGRKFSIRNSMYKGCEVSVHVR